MRVFISAPEQNRFFIDCIKEVVEERGDKWYYPPDEFRNLDDSQILEKIMRELEVSNLVMMDVSMQNFEKSCFPNSGVMIEFGLILNDKCKGLESIYFFCNEATERKNLPPMIPRVEVEKYSEGEENKEKFKKVISEALKDFEKKLPDRLREALGKKYAYQKLIEEKSYTYD